MPVAPYRSNRRADAGSASPVRPPVLQPGPGDQPAAVRHHVGFALTFSWLLQPGQGFGAIDTVLAA